MMQGFAINTATLGFQCPIEKSIEAIAAAGFSGIAPWRREIEGQNVSTIAKRIRDAGLKVTGYCRSTYLPSLTREGLQANIESNRRALDDAAFLGANSFVMVVGGLPKGSSLSRQRKSFLTRWRLRSARCGKGWPTTLRYRPKPPPSAPMPRRLHRSPGMKRGKPGSRPTGSRHNRSKRRCCCKSRKPTSLLSPPC